MTSNEDKPALNRRYKNRSTRSSSCSSSPRPRVRIQFKPKEVLTDVEPEKHTSMKSILKIRPRPASVGTTAKKISKRKHITLNIDAESSVRHLKEIVYLSPSRRAEKSFKIVKPTTQPSLSLKTFLDKINSRLSGFIGSLLGKTRSTVKITRIPIKPGSTLHKKILDEIRMRKREEDTKSMLDRIKSMFLATKTSPNQLKSVNSSNLNHKLDSLIEDNYSLIFESMREADEKNKIVSRRLNAFKHERKLREINDEIIPNVSFKT